MKNPYLIALASALITAGAIKAAPALAEAPVPVSELAVAHVRTADLDLSSADGQRRLDRRLANAAREVCGTASDVDVEGKNDVRKCRDETLAEARTRRDVLLAAAERGAVIAVTAAR